MNWRIVVSEHARTRGIERLSMYPGRVRAEVEAAFADGRVSPHAPAGFRNGRDGVLYAATEDGSACLVVAATEDAIVVVSVLAREGAAA